MALVVFETGNLVIARCLGAGRVPAHSPLAEGCGPLSLMPMIPLSSAGDGVGAKAKQDWALEVARTYV